MDEVEIRLVVTASFVLTLGTYSGPITKKIIAENIDQMIVSNGTVAEFIDDVKIDNVLINNIDQIGD